MPHLPSEENAPDGIFEKIATNPSSKSESTASDSDKPKEQDFITPGPVITESKFVYLLVMLFYL